MALNCINFNQEEPFKGRHIFMAHEAPGNGGEKPEANEKVKSLIDKSGLSEDTLKPLKELIEDPKVKVSEEMVSTALVELERIEKGFSDPEDSSAHEFLIGAFKAYIKDGPLNVTERKKLANLRNKFGKLKVLTAQNRERIMANPAVFFKNTETHKRGLPGRQSLEPGTYAFSPMDNKLAENIISLGTLADLDPSLSSITVIKANGEKKIANKAKGKEGKTIFLYEDGSYASIRNGDEIIIEDEFATVAGTQAAPEKVDLTESQQEAMDAYLAHEAKSVEEYSAEKEAEFAALIASGGTDGLASSNLDAGRELLEATVSTELDWKRQFINPDEGIDNRAVLEEKSGMEFAKFFKEYSTLKMKEADSSLNNEEANRLKEMNDLLIEANNTVKLKPFFREMAPLDQLDSMQDFAFGDIASPALDIIADIPNQLGATSDKLQIWTNALNNGNVSLDSLSFAVFGLNADQLDSEYKNLSDPTYKSKTQLKLEKKIEKARTPEKKEKFKAALEAYKKNMSKRKRVIEIFNEQAKIVLDNLKKIERNDTSVSKYQKMSQKLDFSNLEKNDPTPTMHKTVSKIFDRLSYGIPTRQMKDIAKNKGMVVTEENWNSVASAKMRSKKKTAGLVGGGAFPLASERSQYDKLMNTGSLEGLLVRLEALRIAGEPLYNDSSDLRTSREGKEEDRRIETEAITIEDVKSGTLDKHQIQAIRYGAMLETLSRLDSTKKAADQLEGVQQSIEDSEEEISTMVDKAMEVVREDNEKLPANKRLTEDQLDEISENAKDSFNAFFLFMIESTVVPHYRVNALRGGLGVTKDLGNGFQWDILGEAKVLTTGPNGKKKLNISDWKPVLHNISTGVKYTSPEFGKNGRWEASAMARAGLMPVLDEKLRLLPNFTLAGDIKYDLDQDGLWGIKSGVQLHAILDKAEKNTDLSATLDLLLVRDIDVAMDKRVERFREKRKPEIDEAIRISYERIDGSDKTAKEKVRAKVAYRKYLDIVVKNQAYTTAAPLPQFVEFGPKVAAGGSVGKGGSEFAGFGAALYLGIGLPGRVQYAVVPDQAISSEMLAEVKSTIEASGTSDVTQDIAVPMTEAALFDGRLETKKEEFNAMEENMDTILDQLETENIGLSIGERFTNLDLRGITGIVTFYSDSKEAPVVFEEGGNEMLALNYGPDDHPKFFIKQLVSGQGPDNRVEVYLTDKEDPDVTDFEAIKEKTPSSLTWIQTRDGKRSAIQRKTNSSFTGDKNTESAFKDTDQSADLDAKLFSKEGLEAYQNEHREAAIEFGDRVRGAKLFADPDVILKYRDEAREAAEELKKSGVNYDKLTTDGDTDKLMALFKEELKKPKYGINEHILTPDVVQMAWEYAEELERPDLKLENGKIPAKIKGWNAKALTTLTPHHKLFTDFLDTYDAASTEDKKNKFDQFVPEGSEYAVYIHEGGTKRLHGYHDQEIHGKVKALLKLNAENPAETLNKLGVENTAENRTAVAEFAGAISGEGANGIDWPETSYTNIEYTGEELEDFKRSIDSIVGSLVVGNANLIFSDTQASQLRKAANKGSNTNFEAVSRDFVQIVKELAATGESNFNGRAIRLGQETWIGLHGKCLNLKAGINPTLEVGEPKKIKLNARMASLRGETQEGQEFVQNINRAVVSTPITPTAIPGFIKKKRPAEKPGAVRNPLEALPGTFDKPKGGPGDDSTTDPRG